MSRQYTRTPEALSILERMTQERAGIEPGTTCAVHMFKGQRTYIGHGETVRKAKKIGQCPRYAMVIRDGIALCDAHK